MDDSSSQKDHLNPVQSDYEDKFGSLSRAESSSPNSSKSAQPEQASDISEAENTGSETNGYYRPTGGGKTKGRGRQLLKKFGPTTGIVGLLIGGGIGLGGLLSPSLLIVHLKEIMSSSFNYSDGAVIIRSNKLLYKRFTQTKAGFVESTDGKCNIRCKFGSINKSTAQAMQARANKLGIQLDMVQEKGLFGGDRFRIEKMTFPLERPDGTRYYSEFNTANNGKELEKLLRDRKNASLFKKFAPSRANVFMNKKFSLMLLNKFGLTKLADFGGTTKDAVIESLRKKLKLPTSSDKAAWEAKLNSDPKYKGWAKGVNAAKSAGSKASVATMVCTSYNVGKMMTYSVKAAKIAAFAGFAMLFLTVADQIKAGANPDPEVVSQLGGQLTSYSTDKGSSNYGKSATDSSGYKMAAYGDYPSSLSEEDKKFSIAPSGDVLKFISKLIVGITIGGVGALVAAKVTCKTAIVASVASACAVELAVAATTGFATAGIGALASAAECLAKLAIMTYVLGEVLSFTIGKIIEAAVGSELPQVGPDTYGADAGNAIASGTGAIMGGQASSLGMKPGTKEEIKQYALDTNEIRNQEIATKMYDAKTEPLNPYNQYSFLGMVLNKFGFYNFAYNKNISKFASLSGLFVNSLRSLMPTSYAYIDNATRKSEIYGKCSDPSIISLGIDADMFCNPGYVMSSEELSAENDDVLSFMISKKYIDEDTGDALEGSDYAKFTQYCSDRDAPLGESDLPIEDDNYVWSIGANCFGGNIDEGYAIDKDTASKFRIYTMDKSLNDNFDEL